MEQVVINGRKVGDGNPAYIIAEMSANHAGSLERAKEMIHVAKEVGADCVKIQTYTADTMTIDCHNQYFDITEGTWKGINCISRHIHPGSGIRSLGMKLPRWGLISCLRLLTRQV